MKKGSNLKSINRSYHSQMRRLTKNGRERDILAALSNGKNTYLRMDRLESSSFDSSWIEVIENVIFDLGEIIANPRQVTKTEGNIVPIELARKISADSVQHLASHTQYIKEIDDYGNVIPSKILTMMNEDDIKTYENRFIATFVRRLVLFIEKRYEFVSNFAELHDESVLMFKSKAIVEGAEVEIETKIKINRKSDDEVSLKSNEYVERIKQMREYILYFYSSPFMKMLKTEKDVHNPIIQTNIIRKNPLYHHCYEVYRFIEKYEHLGVHYKVDEKYSIFNNEELAEINNTLFANYITLKGKEPSKINKGTEKVYKPKILTSLDDEAFIYGPLFAGPIEFLRIDEPYQKYLDSKVRQDLPLHPTKRDKEYYADEYAQKAQNKEDLKQKNDLIKRKNKEVAAFNKLASKIDEEREEARLKLLQQEKEIIKQEENDLLTAARNAIIAESLKDHAQETYERRLNEITSTKVVEASHPYEKPVSYDEAVLQIWPQLAKSPKQSQKKAPSKKEQPVIQKAEPVQEQPVLQAPVKEEVKPVVVETPKQEQPIKPAPKPVVVKEYTHPYSKPVSYDEVALEIWPALASAPTKRVARQEKQPVEVKKAPTKKEQPQVKEVSVAQEAPKETKPQKEVVKAVPHPAEVKEYQHPYTKPVSYDEAALEIWPNLANAPALRKAPKEETKPVKAPVNKPVPKKVESKPVKETKPAPLPKQEKKPEPVIVKAEQPVKEENKAPKAEPKKAPEKKPTPAPAPVEKPREKIPGRFIVKTNEGYYVNNDKYSVYKEDAKVFDDFNLAKDVKKEKGGKIIKL